MAQVEKIYSLKTLGFDQIMAELDALSKKFVEIKKAKQDAAKTAADTAKAQGVESQAYKDAAKALDEQKIKELELKAAIKEKTNEAKAAQLVRQEEINQQKAAIAGNAAEVRSIAAIRKERSELNAAVIRVTEGNPVNFRGNTLQYDEAIAKLKELSAVEQAFRRQFQQDGTLVGEYTTGIIQAFKKLGIDDLVTGQVNKANERLQSLNEQFEVLKSELRSIGTGSFDKLASELNIVKNAGVSGFESIEAKIKEVSTSGGVSLSKIDQILQEIRADGNTALSGLEKELLEIRSSTNGALGNLEKELITNRKEALALQQQIGTLQTELRGTGDIGNQITTGLANGFKNMKGQLSSFLLSYVGFQAAFQGIMAGIDTAKELSDQTTSLEVEFGKAAGGMDKFVTALAKINTRTPLTELENIANIAAKAGVSEDNLVGVAEAIDKIKIAFGKDFGDVETGTESLVKLINVFEGTGQVTGENLLKVGNAVRTLANETVASVPFLNDFAKRMAGLKGISDISLPAVLGLGSGFEQFGQSAEVAGTTLTKVIPKLATDTEKYAQIAGITQKAFSDLLKSNPAEALIKVSEGLVKGKGSIEEISTAFADSHLGSGRIAAVLGVLGSKADDFRKSIASAGNAFNDTGNIEAAFTAKNENLAATIDKIKKAFADASNSKAFQATLSIISTLILALIHNLPALITVLSLYTAGWALANREMILARAELIFQRTVLPILTFLFGGTANAMKAYAIATQLAAAAMRILTTLMANPIFKIFAATLGLSLIALESFGKGINSLGQAYDLMGAKQSALKEIQADATRQTTETLAKEQALLAIVKDRTLADETRSKALTELKNIAGGYLDNLNLENVLTEKGTRLINEFNAQLERKARLNAADAISQRENNKLTTLYQYQFDIQNAIKTQGEVNTSQFSKEFLDAYYKQQGRSASAIGKFIGDKVGIDFTYSGKDLNDFSKLVQSQISDQLNKTRGALLAQTETKNNNVSILSANLKQAKDEVDQLSAKVKNLQVGTKEYADAAGQLNEAQGNVIRKRKELYDALGKPLNTAAPAAPAADGEIVSVQELQKQLASVNKQIADIDKIKSKTEVQINELKNLRKQKQDLIKEIREMGGTTGAPKASSLSATDKDAFNIVESNMQRELAAEETRVTEIKKTRQLTYDEEVQYVNNITAINVKYINQKIGILESEKSLNAKEKAELATFHKDRADIELRGLQQLQVISEREFSQRQTRLRNQLDEEIAAVKEADNITQADPSKTNTERAQSKLNADNQILDLYKRFNTQVDVLEKQLGVTSVKNSREIVNQINALNKDKVAAQKDLMVAALKDVQATGDRLISEFKATMAAARLAIQNNNKLTPEKKTTALAEVDRQENLGIIAREVASEKQQLPIYENLLKTKQITDKEYNDFITKMRTDQSKLLDSTTTDLQINVIKVTDISSFISKKVRSLFSFDTVNSGDDKATVDKKVALQEMFAQTVSQTFSLAKTAMDDYYNAEQQQIERSRANKEKQLQFELDQAKAGAQSQAEKDSLDKQFAAKKEANDRAAFEKNKKVQKQQALVNLAMQLSNIAVVSTAPGPANLLTVGVFGEVMYALQTVIALAAYAMNVKRIDSAQFAEGGDIPSRGGVIRGRKHSQGGVKFNYEAEDEEMSIIRTKNAPRNKIFQVTGTLHQIASQTNVLGGGVSFAPGAKLKRFDLGGNIASRLSAPVFVPSTNSNGVSQNNNADIIAALTLQNQSIQQLAAETSKRFERIEVVQVTSSVTKAQQKQVTQRAIGTL